MLESFYLTYIWNPLILEYILSLIKKIHPSVFRLENLDQAFDTTVFKVFSLVLPNIHSHVNFQTPNTKNWKYATSLIINIFKHLGEVNK